MKATILKVSESGKSFFVRIQLNPFDRGTVGYCNSIPGKVKGDVIEDFPKPTGLKPMIGEGGEVRTTKEGTPLQEFTFM